MSQETQNGEQQPPVTPPPVTTDPVTPPAAEPKKADAPLIYVMPNPSPASLVHISPMALHHRG